MLRAYYCVCHSPAKIGELAKGMLGSYLVTKQTPPGGVLVRKVWWPSHDRTY